MTAVRLAIPIGPLAAGFVTGLRSQMMFAVMARAAGQGEFAVDADPPVEWLRSPAVGKLTMASAAGELVVDKLPFTPNRIDPLPLAGRLVFGTLAGGTLAAASGNRVAGGALSGMVGAAAGSYAGYWARTRTVRKLGWPDMAVALTEDAITIVLARFTVQSAR